MTDTDIPAGLVFAEEPDPPRWLNYLLYGPVGAGKSSAAATAPGPVLWLNAEGPNALAYPRKVARERGAAIYEVRFEMDVDPRPQLREIVKHLRAGADPVPATVALDTLGRLRELLIAAIVVPGAKNSLQQFGEVAKALRWFVGCLRDLPVNTVLIAHESIEDAEGERIVRPLIGGALTEYIPSEADVVAYCHAHRDGDAVQYLGQLVEGRGRRCKDRSGGLGVVRPLDLTEWLQAFRAALAANETDLPFSEHYQPPADGQHPNDAAGVAELEAALTAAEVDQDNLRVMFDQVGVRVPAGEPITPHTLERLTAEQAVQLLERLDAWTIGD